MLPSSRRGTAGPLCGRQPLVRHPALSPLHPCAGRPIGAHGVIAGASRVPAWAKKGCGDEEGSIPGPNFKMSSSTIYTDRCQRSQRTRCKRRSWLGRLATRTNESLPIASATIHHKTHCWPCGATRCGRIRHRHGSWPSRPNDTAVVQIVTRAAMPAMRPSADRCRLGIYRRHHCWPRRGSAL